MAASTLAAKRSGQQHAKHRGANSVTATHRLGRDCSAWYDRHRRVLPWRAQPGRARRSLSRLALRNHAATDDGQGRRALLRAIPGALARTCPRSPRRRSTMCSRPGPGSAITPAPAICMPARAPSSNGMAEKFRRPKPCCASFPASAPIRPPRSPRSPSMRRRARSTAISSASSRGSLRVDVPLPAAKPEICDSSRAR